MTRPPRDRRAKPRFALGFRAFDATATVNGSPVVCINISLSGMLVRVQSEVLLGPTAEVIVPGLAPRKALVVWQGNALLGLQFAEPLIEAEFAALLAGAE